MIHYIFVHVLIVGVVFSNGEVWKSGRRFCLRTLRDFGLGKLSLEGKIMEDVKMCINEFIQQNNQPFDPQFIMGRCVSNIISSITFGQRFEYNDPVFLQFLQELDENTGNNGKLELLHHFPFLKYVPGDPCCYKRIISYFRSVSDFVDEQIKQHRGSFDPQHVRSFIDAYLKEESEMANRETDGLFAGQYVIYLLKYGSSASYSEERTLAGFLKAHLL